MTIYEKIEDYVSTRKPLVLTIGNFDGMHRGHSEILKQALKIAGENGEAAVITFSNHPSEVLRPEQPIPLLCTLPHKLRLMTECGFNSIILISFTRYLSKHSAGSFVEQIRQYIPFSHLVLGHDATLGKDKQGNRSAMEHLGMEWGFDVHYINEYRFEGQPVSSTRIRNALQQGNLIEAEQLLNRPFSIYGPAERLITNHYSTIIVDASKLCLPPAGNYEVEICLQSKRHKGIASISENKHLELQMLEKGIAINGNNFEVLFKS